MPKTGFRHSEESKQKMRDSLKGRPGHKHSIATREKMRLSKLGEKNPMKRPEVREKMRVARNLKPRQQREISDPIEWKKHRSWVKNKRNRVLKRLISGNLTHSFGEWELLKKQYGFTCPACKLSEPQITLTEDHIIPLSKGGTDKIENIQPLCGSCNRKKYTKIIRY